MRKPAPPSVAAPVPSPAIPTPAASAGTGTGQPGANAAKPGPAALARKSRVGKMVKPDKKAPAAFEPGPPEAPPPAPPPPFDAQAVAEKLDLWRLDGSKGQHLRLSKDDEYIDLSGDDFTRLMKRNGVRTKPADGEVLSDADQLKDCLQESRRVDFAMVNLAGFKRGIYRISGAVLMVKKSPRLITPKAGEWSFIRALIERMLATEAGAATLSQVTLFHAWMKACINPERKSGLALILAGPRDCGKSVLQHLIITPLLGGRNADPGPHMFGDTDFNAELFGSEHLQMEDPAPKNKFSKEAFAEKIKGIVANNTQRFHPKGRDAVTLAPKWHLSISVNDDPETMKIIPEFREDVADKLLLLRVQRPQDGDGFALPADHERGAFRERIALELPAYAAFLEAMEVPEAYHGKRFGVKAWQNPTLATRLFDDSPTGRLLALIDGCSLWDKEIRAGLDKGCGTFAELRTELEVDITYGDEAKGLFKFYRIEHLLGKLLSAHPDRIEHPRLTSGPHKGSYLWKILPRDAGG